MPDSESHSALTPLEESSLQGADRGQIMSALFENFVTQQGSLGLSLLGELPGTENQSDVASAKLVIDQLEMFEFKTRGNLSPEEAAFLRKTLTVLGEALVTKLGSGDQSGVS